MEDEVSPTTIETGAPDSPATAAATEAPPTPVASVVAPASVAKPDIATLLQDPEVRRELFRHPDLLREIDHRAASEAGRRAKAEVERWHAGEQARVERERLASMDEYELGQEYKKQLEHQQREVDLYAQLGPYQAQVQTALLRQTGEEVFSTVYGLAQEAGATDSELAQLDPRNYPSLGAFVKGAIQFMGTREGKKLAKDMAKMEAKAMLEEQAAQEREKGGGPAVLPPAEPSLSDKDFIAAFADGTSNDYQRARRFLGI